MTNFKVSYPFPIFNDPKQAIVITSEFSVLTRTGLQKICKYRLLPLKAVYLYSKLQRIRNDIPWSLNFLKTETGVAHARF